MSTRYLGPDLKRHSCNCPIFRISDIWTIQRMSRTSAARKRWQMSFLIAISQIKQPNDEHKLHCIQQQNGYSTTRTILERKHRIQSCMTAHRTAETNGPQSRSHTLTTVTSPGQTTGPRSQNANSQAANTRNTVEAKCWGVINKPREYGTCRIG